MSIANSCEGGKRDQSIGYCVGNNLRVDRVGFFYLWQEAGIIYSTFKWSGTDDRTLFRRQYLSFDCDRGGPGRVAILLQGVKQ
jgi:hypothetical protein